MNKDYTKYTSKELMEDDFFIQSMIHPTMESDEFWNSLLADGVLEYEEFEEAQSFILLMQRPKKIMTAKERNDIWIYIEVKNKLNLRKNIRHKKMYLCGAAASLLLIVLIFSALFYEKTASTEWDFEEMMAGIPDTTECKDIQLILSNNRKIELENTSADIELNNEGEVLVNSKQMAKTGISAEEGEMSNNQLIVPMGRHSQLTLPDGTRMHINAGSKVVFPHKFKNKKREIFVDGEVFLEVAQNRKAPFIVHTATMKVKVTGTSFNVRAYKADDGQEVVLVAGSVRVHTKDNQETILSPNQKLGYSEGKCHVSPVNAQEYVSWIKGYFIYDKEPLPHIIKQISRYYGIKIVCGQKINSLTCSGKLDLKEDLDVVMNDLARLLTLKIDKSETTYFIN